MSYDRGLVARVADALEGIGERGARQKNVFGGRGFLLGKKTFAIVWEEGLLVKAPAAEYAALLREPGIAPFAPDGGRSMSTWLVVPDSAVADDPELLEWLRRGLAGIR
jgi:TfoX/Sxy family transcriptional regulator of competence genes